MHACLQTVLEYLKSISADVTLVQGDFDEFTAPEQAVRQVCRVTTHVYIDGLRLTALDVDVAGADFW